MSPPTISVVTPVLNGDRFLEDAMRSVLEQDYPRVEYFVQDGGSSDNTVALLRKYESRLCGWVSGPDEGQSDALNRAFARTTGEILAWINADDFYESGAFTHVAEVLAAHPEASALVGCAWLLYPDGTRVERCPHNVSLPGLLNWRTNWIPQQAVFFRRSAWERVGPLDTSLELAMDFDLWCKLVKVGTFVPTDRVLAASRQHPDAKCFAHAGRMYDETRRVILRHAGPEQLRAQYADLHKELSRVDRVCEALLVEHVRSRWRELPERVVLFGAGAHTPWLLGVIDGVGASRVSVILDDNAEEDQKVHGIDVIRPEVLQAPPPVVVLSTDTLQETLTERCRKLFGGAVRVVDLYEGLGPGPYPKSDTHRAGWT